MEQDEYNMLLVEYEKLELRGDLTIEEKESFVSLVVDFWGKVDDLLCDAKRLNVNELPDV